MQVNFKGRNRSFRTVEFDSRRNVVRLIEQRWLPHTFQQVECTEHRSTARAIRDMVVRGAGAIGATAAYGLAQGALEFSGRSFPRFRRSLASVFKRLADARPTAVDPVNAMTWMLSELDRSAMVSVADGQEFLLKLASQFADDDVSHCEAIGRHGMKLIRDGARVLTHCNAGWLAFVDVGSATAPMYAAHSAGRKFFVFCDETRPRCQGASLTAWELSQQGIEHAIIADNAAGHFMQRGEVDLVIVGSDRVIGRTGEVANKIGTYTKAVLAKRHGIPIYVAIPLSTIDWNMTSGRDIPIEERNSAEVLGAWGIDSAGKRRHLRIANPASPARNPGFDVTPPDLITGIITPTGILRPRELWKKRSQLGWEGSGGERA